MKKSNVKRRLCETKYLKVQSVSEERQRHFHAHCKGTPKTKKHQKRMVFLLCKLHGFVLKAFFDGLKHICTLESITKRIFQIPT